jgi:hypothetical protein
MNAQVNIPEGYWLDPKGNLVPDANVKEIDKLRDQTVRRIWALAEALHQEMKNFKATSFDDVASFCPNLCRSIWCKDWRQQRQCSTA